MKRAADRWRRLKHPLRMSLRGWKWGERCIVSPRGTVYVTRPSDHGTLARRQNEYELS